MINFFKLKKIKYFICMQLVIICLALSGCSGAESKEDNAGAVYFIDSSGQSLISKEYQFNGNGTSDRIAEVIGELSKSNEKASLTGPLTMGAGITNYVIDGQKAIITWDTGYNRLSNIQQALIVSAVVKSLTTINGIDEVAFYLAGQPLSDSDGAQYPAFTSDMFIVDDDLDNITGKDIMVAIYYADINGNSLIKTQKLINYTEGKMETEILKLLIEGPKEDGLYPTINPSTVIKSVSIKDGICSVDFSDDFLNQTCNVSSDVAIYSIVNTMCSLDNISKVQISVNGNKAVTYQEKYNLENVYERNQNLVIQ